MYFLSCYGYSTGLRLYQPIHHINSKHKAEIKERFECFSKRPRDILNSLSYPTKTLSIFSWLQSIILCLLLFSSCQTSVILRNFKYRSISIDTLMKYLNLLTKHVEIKIQTRLAAKFPIVFDGWSSGDTHYLGEFAIYPFNCASGYESIMLSPEPMGAEESLTAEEHYKFLKYLLGVFDKNIENVVALVGDNANTNKAFANRIGPIFVGRHSHRCNVTVKDILSGHKMSIAKVRFIMKNYHIRFQQPSFETSRI